MADKGSPSGSPGLSKFAWSEPMVIKGSPGVSPGLSKSSLVGARGYQRFPLVGAQDYQSCAWWEPMVIKGSHGGSLWLSEVPLIVGVQGDERFPCGNPEL